MKGGFNSDSNPSIAMGSLLQGEQRLLSSSLVFALDEHLGALVLVKGAMRFAAADLAARLKEVN